LWYIELDWILGISVGWEDDTIGSFIEFFWDVPRIIPNCGCGIAIVIGVIVLLVM